MVRLADVGGHLVALFADDCLRVWEADSGDLLHTVSLVGTQDCGHLSEPWGGGGGGGLASRTVGISEPWGGGLASRTVGISLSHGVGGWLAGLWASL